MSDDLSRDLASLKIDRTPPAPRSRGWLGWLVALVLLGGAGVVGVVALPMVSARVYQTEVETTSVRLMSPAGSSVLVTATGYVAAERTSTVGARVPGRVVEVKVREGDTVVTGDVLAILDDAEQRTALAAARARAAAARARAASARANLDEVSRQLERERLLAAQGASARAVAEDLEARARSLREAAEAAEADATAAAGEERTLEVNLQHLTVRAPIDGRVVARPVAAGELVGPAGAAVAKLADFASLVVETDVPEARLASIRREGPAEIVLDAWPSVRHRGRVVDISPTMNRAKATVVVKVRFEDPVTDVLPDMAARVGFLSEELDAAAMKEPPKLFVPGSAVVERAGRKVVFVVAEGKAKEQPVELGGALGSGFTLTAGPADGTRLVDDPPPELLDGFPIREKAK